MVTSATEEMDQQRRQREREQQQTQRTSTGLPRNVAASAAPGGPVTIGDTERGAALYSNPNAAFINALRARGIDPYTSYYGSQLRRRYTGATRDLFDLDALARGQAAGETNPGAASEAGLAGFQDFVNRLVNGVSGGLGLQQSIGFDPSQALKTIFDETRTGPEGKPAGIGWARFMDPSTGITDQNAMRTWLREMQASLLGLSGANPALAQARLAQTGSALNEWDAAYGGGRITDPNDSWLKLILGRV